MPLRLYELRAARAGQATGDQDAFLAAVDLTDLAAAGALLDRHLTGAALRAGAELADIHLYRLDARHVNDHGAGYGDVVFRWALPVGGER